MLAEVVVVDSRLMGGAVGGGPDAPPMAGPTPERTQYPTTPNNFSSEICPSTPCSASADDSYINHVLGTLPPPVSV